MGFVERLKQELALTAQKAEQLAAQEQAVQEAREKIKLQAEATEQERIARGRKLADGFRLESGVGEVVAELGKFLATPTIPVTRSSFSDGLHSSWTERIGRGSSSGPLYETGSDCVFDEVSWDRTKLPGIKQTGYGWYEYFSVKKINVQTSPDGTIRFNAGWGGSSTIRLEQWRGSKREEIIDRALEKAFTHPRVDKESVHHDPVQHGFG